MAAHDPQARIIYPAPIPYSQQVPQQKPVRVDPFAPLPTSFAPVENADHASWPEEVQKNSVATPEQPKDDLARAASRKRRVSGTGRGPRKSHVTSHPQPPAPEVPPAPSAPYQRQHAMNGTGSRTSDPTSFAARAHGLSDNEDFPSVDAHQSPEPIVQPANPKRRESKRRSRERAASNELGPGNGREVSQPSSTQSGVPIQQPRIVDIPAQRRVVESKAVPLEEPPSVEEPQSDAAPPPARSNARKSSAGHADAGREWAPDRSPLQKLEVKLNDISKEEKRARVEKAEQRLRESKANGERLRAGQEKQLAEDRTSARRPSAKRGVMDEAPPEQSRQDDHKGHRENRARRSAAPAYVEDIDRQQMERNQGSARDQPLVHSGVPSSGKARSRVLEQQPPQSLPADSITEQVGERGVRFHGQVDNGDLNTDPNVHVAQRSPQTRNFSRTNRRGAGPQEPFRQEQPSMGVRTSKGVSKQQQALYSGKGRHSGKAGDPTAFGGAPDPVSARSVRGQSDAVKYEIPPQTAAGIEARQKVGFDDTLGTPAQAPGHHKHHLSDILHHGKKNAPNSSPQLGPQPRHSDEWRQGGTARLTAAELVVPTDDAKNQSAWWEEGNARDRRTSDKAQVQQNPGTTSLGHAGQDHAQETRSFDPPLYLACGPLLRYTGLKRDKLHASRLRSNNRGTERESWRGSVMIVTADGGSDYSDPPILRLFPEPIELLPLPPLQVNGESGHSLPSEYIDPIAGLPKLSRTGTTVYVKPVEDLDPGVDLSCVETDDGLFEETRTAAVPTSYGKPDPRFSQSQQNDSKMAHVLGRTRSKSQSVRGVRLHAERGVTFWRFNLGVELGTQQTRIAYSINNGPSVGFWVPAKGQSMNVMFHSCNGFSMNVK